jgi:hypothetical protein
VRKQQRQQLGLVNELSAEPDLQLRRREQELITAWLIDFGI